MSKVCQQGLWGVHSYHMLHTVPDINSRPLNYIANTR
uniref:Uncharacterized protein n=2 Tax=Anguilla anguilla TaxID=7936 RepID=A0A0E9RMP3_ANGAN